MPDAVQIKSRSINLLVAFNDTDIVGVPATVVLQERSDTNQDDKPQSYPGGKQLTAAMKIDDFGGLFLPNLDGLPPLTADIDYLIQAAEKECGSEFAETVRAVALANSEAAETKIGDLILLHDEVTAKGKWVRTIGLKMTSPQSGQALLKLLAKPKEVSRFLLCTAPDAIRDFIDDDKTTKQSGGKGVAPDDLAMFPDDARAVKKGLALMFNNLA